MTIDLDILAFTFEAATRGESEFAGDFYDELTRRCDECAHLLERSDRHRLERMLAHTIVSVLAHVDDPVWLRQNLVPLGRRHDRLGIEPFMYDLFSECLIDCLEDHAGADWPNNARRHWNRAMELVSSTMQQEMPPAPEDS